MSNSWDSSNWGYNGSLGPRQRTPVISSRMAAEMYRLGPDSNVILMDQSGKMIWIVATDAAGCRTVEPYDISPHSEPEPPDYNAILLRMNKMEEMLSGLVAATNNSRTGANATVQSTANTTHTNTSSSELAKQF